MQSFWVDPPTKKPPIATNPPTKINQLQPTLQQKTTNCNQPSNKKQPIATNQMSVNYSKIIQENLLSYWSIALFWSKIDSNTVFNFKVTILYLCNFLIENSIKIDKSNVFLMIKGKPTVKRSYVK